MGFSKDHLPTTATPSETMTIRAAQELREGEVVFVGIGLPNLACNLARHINAKNLFLIYESGAVGALPERLPTSIGDPALVANCLSVVSQADIFQNYLQRGLIDTGFLGGAQIDRYGNLNTTVIGNYFSPKVRLPGSGGACEIAVHSKRVLIIMRMTPKSFVEKCDFVTSPGHQMESNTESQFEGQTRRQLGLPGQGPTQVITDLGVLSFLNGELTLTKLYAGVTLEKVRSACGWTLKVSKDLVVLDEPGQEYLRLLREKLDPDKMYL